MRLKLIFKWILKHWILSLILLVLLSLCIWQTYISNMRITDWILAITAIAIFIYTYWSYKQTDAVIRPVCTVHIREDKFIIDNVGLGPALNIKAEFLEIGPQGSKDGFSFMEIPAIEKENGRYLEISQEFISGEPVQKGSINLKYTNWTNESYDLSIIYEDCKNKKYHYIVECKKQS